MTEGQRAIYNACGALYPAAAELFDHISQNDVDVPTDLMDALELALKNYKAARDAAVDAAWASSAKGETR